MKLHHSRTIIAASLAAITVAACSTPPEEETPDPLIPVAAEEYVFPVELAGDYTVRWTAANGIDLTSPEATIVRAISETVTLSGLVGEKLSYPGWYEFWEEYNSKPDIVGRTRTLGSPSAWRYLGTDDYFLYLLEETDNGIRAEYCTDVGYRASSQDYGKTYEWYDGTRPRVFAHGVILERLPESTHSPRPAMSEARRAPNWNVFEGWDGVKLFAPGDYHFCRDWYETRQRDPDMPEWVTTTGTPPAELPPVKPPHPGW